VANLVFLGLATVDLIYEVESVPHENQKCVAQRQEIACGGPAANAAVASAFLGANATLISSVGAHPLAGVIQRELQHFRVSLLDVAPCSAEVPPLSSILVSQSTGARTVISGHATRKQVSPDALHGSSLDGADLLLVDGHQPACAIKAASLAKSKRIPVVFDGGSWKARTDELLAHTQIAICSEDFRPPGTNAASDTLDYVLSRGPESAVITRGSNSILWATRQHRGEIHPPRITPVDTLGAGDIFHGAFCFQFAEGSGLVEALTFAAEVAAHSCKSFGTRSWMKTS
jgi:sugar/nucleoside kinase (ribokinase family)